MLPEYSPNMLIKPDKTVMKKIVVVILLFILFACKKPDIEYDYPQDPQNIQNFRNGRFFGNVVVYDANKKKNKNYQSKSDPVMEKQDNNNILFGAAFEVISSLFPISVSDSNSGILVTEWYTEDESQDFRTKINLLVKDNQLKEESLLITIFKQQKDSKGIWQDLPNKSNDLAVKLLKEKIISKAQKIANN